MLAQIGILQARNNYENSFFSSTNNTCDVTPSTPLHFKGFFFFLGQPLSLIIFSGALFPARTHVTCGVSAAGSGLGAVDRGSSGIRASRHPPASAAGS